MKSDVLSILITLLDQKFYHAIVEHGRSVRLILLGFENTSKTNSSNEFSPPCNKRAILYTYSQNL